MAKSPVNFGYTVIAEFLFCFFVGYFADQKYGTGYLWTFVGLGVAIALVSYEVWKLTRQ